MIIPHDVNTQGIESHGFDHLDSMFPVFNWDSGVVDFTGVYFGIQGTMGGCIDVGFEGVVFLC